VPENPLTVKVNFGWYNPTKRNVVPWISSSNQPNEGPTGFLCFSTLNLPPFCQFGISPQKPNYGNNRPFDDYIRQERYATVNHIGERYRPSDDKLFDVFAQSAGV